MEEIGFAIRCPYCGNWNIHATEHPKDFAVTVNEMHRILADFRDASSQDSVDSFLHTEKRLFRCKQPRWACPASFEAFIFDKETTALTSLKQIKGKWAISRDFRLYTADTVNRWEGRYYGIMFGIEPVRRLRDIELEHLFDRGFMSKIITGICQEIGSPVTIYSANVIKGVADGDLYWMPIEHYADETSFIPTRYNIFCETCRKVTIGSLEHKFLSNFRSNVESKIKNLEDDSHRTRLSEILGRLNAAKNVAQCVIDPTLCPFKNPVTSSPYWDETAQKCAGRTPACRMSKKEDTPVDLNHCPAFIDMRRKHCFCYSSDMKLIHGIRKTWKEKTDDGPSECPANFVEIGIPITVHEHLVGVAVMGQMFTPERPIASYEDFEKSVRFGNPDAVISRKIKGERGQKLRDRLEMVRHVLLWQEEQARNETKEGEGALALGKPRCCVTKVDMGRRISALKRNAHHIQLVAETRYRDLRSRSEQVFRDEISGYVHHEMATQPKSSHSFFSGNAPPIVHVLRRMIDFWAFTAVLYVRRNEDGVVFPIAYATATPSNPGQGFGFLEVNDSIGYIRVKDVQEHPVCWLLDPERSIQPPQNEIVIQLHEQLRSHEHYLTQLGMPTDGCYFFVIVPFEGAIHALIFAKRRKELLSRTDAQRSSAVSELCREYMLRTCTEFISEVCDVSYRELHSSWSDPNRSSGRRRGQVPTPE